MSRYFIEIFIKRLVQGWEAIRREQGQFKTLSGSESRGDLPLIGLIIYELPKLEYKTGTQGDEGPAKISGPTGDCRSCRCR